jgi:hypothetical protein
LPVCCVSRRCILLLHHSFCFPFLLNVGSSSHCFLPVTSRIFA